MSDKKHNMNSTESGMKCFVSGKSERSGKLDTDRIVSIASVEYTKWICNPRIVLYICMLAFMMEYVIREFYRVHMLMGEKVMIFEPFIALGNSTLMYLVLPVVFIVLMGDFPKTDGNTMFYIQRCGKQNWLLGQALFAVLADITYISVTAIVSMIAVLPYGVTTDDWSISITKLADRFPEEAHSKITDFINNRMYNNMRPKRAFILTFVLMLMYLLLISMIMLLAFSVGKRLIGIGICVTVMAVGTGLAEVGASAMWFFPAAHAIMWTHFDRILRKQIVGVRTSYLFFLVLIILCICISFKAIRHYDFAKITDMED